MDVKEASIIDVMIEDADLSLISVASQNRLILMSKHISKNYKIIKMRLNWALIKISTYRTL